jgi:hypothetical protein
MPGVIVSVEPNEITMQDTQEQLIAHRQDAIDLTAGEWGMQEEPNLDILLARADFFA